VEVIGNVTTPFDIEKAVAAAPDLIVTLDGDPADPAAYWSIDPEIVDLVRQVAPILAINSNYTRTDQVVSRFADLAAALGADLDGSDVSAARDAFAEAETAFAGAVAANPDLTCLFVYPSEDGLYVANPKVVSDLLYFRELGLAMPDLDAADT
jgi:iron complex transport system substrate-binding protein